MSDGNSKQSLRDLTKRTSVSDSADGSDVSSGGRDLATKRSKSVVVGRGLFTVFLLIVAAILGFLSYYFLTESENALVEEQYYSMVASALTATQTLATNKLLHGSDVMAKVASFSAPDAAEWPFIWVDGYFDIVKSVTPTSAWTGLHLCPIVSPEVLPEWEEFAYGKYKETFGNDTDAGARSHFGAGVWIQDSSIDTVDNRMHDTTGVSLHGSPYDMIAPKFQHASGDKSGYIMMNVHGFKTQSQALDAVINCTKSERPNDPTKNCQALSGMNVPMVQPTAFAEMGTFSFIATPIFPKNDPDTLVGFIFGAIWWVEVMEEVFPSDAEGIDCVMKGTFEDSASVYSYTIKDGSGVFVGPGDLHDPKYDEFKMEEVLIEPDMSGFSAVYTLTCYPNDNFSEVYTTVNPIAAAIGAVMIIIITSALFFLYDRFVTKEFDSKNEYLEAKRQFVRFVSHEVRTPLNSVCMGLTLLKEEIAQSVGFKNAQEMLDSDTEIDSTRDGSWFDLAHEVQVNAQSSVDVLNDLLNYDKIETGTLMQELTILPIWSLIDRTVNEFKLPMASKNIKLFFNSPTNENVKDQKVVGDSVRITQVLRNLISNAIKFTPDGKSIHIDANWKKSTGPSKKHNHVLKTGETISADSSGELVVTVKDTGAGMTKEQVKKLFGKGIQFNVNELQHGNGSGLGLYIAMGIVKQHGGSLVCDSEGLGLGTTFTVTIPLYDIPSTDSDSDLAGSMAGTDYKEEKLRILIVDDAVSNRKLLGRLLKKNGHESHQAEDGNVAVDMVDTAERQYDLVLMDYEMPNLNGPGACKKIRENGHDVFIVGVTGNVMPEDIAYFRSCGANAVLPKPFRISELEEIIFEHHITGSLTFDNQADCSRRSIDMAGTMTES
jgi:signal transduction histidine kinase/CheY-like chemotaxis protein